MAARMETTAVVVVVVAAAGADPPEPYRYLTGPVASLLPGQLPCPPLSGHDHLDRGEAAKE